jgi:hypothetical protein
VSDITRNVHDLCITLADYFISSQCLSRFSHLETLVISHTVFAEQQAPHCGLQLYPILTTLCGFSLNSITLNMMFGYNLTLDGKGMSSLLEDQRWKAIDDLLSDEKRFPKFRMFAICIGMPTELDMTGPEVLPRVLPRLSESKRLMIASRYK